MTKVDLKVDGMTCMGCVNNVKNLLKPMPGVSNVDISLQEGRVTISFDAAKSKVEDFKTAIRDAGYDVQN